MKFARLFVLIFGLFVPIYILITFLEFEFTLSWLPFEASPFWFAIVDIVCPILFCGAWLYFMLLLGKRFASTIEIMGKTSSTISAHYIIFYGICAFVMLLSFLLSFFTPIVGVLAYASLMFKLLTSKVAWDDLDDKTRKFVKSISILASIPILICAILVFPELIGLSITFFKLFWLRWLDPLYNIIRALGVALPVGNFMLLYRNAIGQVEGRQTGAKRSHFDILVVEFAITGLLIALMYWEIEFVNVLLYVGLLFWVMTFFFNFIQGRNAGKRGGTSGVPPQSPLSLLLFGIFWGATMIFGSGNYLSDMVRYVVVGGAAFVFVIAFIMIFIGHPELED